MENAILISLKTAQRVLGKVPKTMGTASIYPVYKRRALQGYSIVVRGKALNEQAMSLLT